MKKYDYTQNGFYFVTLCTSEKRKSISSYKKILERELINLTKRFKFVEVNEKIFMDNHCHLIFKLEDVNISLPKIIQAYKSITTLKIKKNGYKYRRFWQPNYYEHIVRSQRELLKIKLYIRAHPYGEKIDWTKVDDYVL
ncbi:MAG: transposase [bacterium]